MGSTKRLHSDLQRHCLMSGEMVIAMVMCLPFLNVISI